MTTDMDFDLEVEEAPAEESSVEDTPANDKAEKKSKRAPLPDGFVTPVGLTNAINESLEVPEWGQSPEDYDGPYFGPLAPQSMYGYVKNNKDLKDLIQFSSDPTDTRAQIPLSEGLEWFKGITTKRIEREANRVAKEAAKDETAESEEV